MATTQEYAIFSEIVYGGPDTPALPPGWQNITGNLPNYPGLHAGVFQKISDTGQILETVVAFKGTTLTDGGDRRADLDILNGRVPPQFYKALDLVTKIKVAYSDAPVSVTGHSLGGAEAEYVSGSLGISGETFGAPGISQLNGLEGLLDNGQLINHINVTDLIGNYGGHVGTTDSVIALPNPLQALGVGLINPYAGIVDYVYLSHQIEIYKNYFNSAKSAYSCPIILDFDGDGVETTALQNGAYFDHDGNGFAEQMGWVGADDGLLVWDRNADGLINDGKELFGNETVLADGTKAANGFQALAELDGNGDGKVDANDVGFANLEVWKDVDGDGYTSAGELFSLADVGVMSINTGYADSTYVDAQGNQHRQIGSFTKTDGTMGDATDVWFQHDLTNTIAGQWLEVPADIAAMPDLQGYGNVYDLHQAMTRDATLKTLVQDFTAQADPSTRNVIFEQILFRWAGSDALDPSSRGVAIDARKLGVLEKFYGETFTGIGGENPNIAAARLLNESYAGLSEMVYSELMAQTHLKALYDLVTYTWDNATRSLKGDLSAVKMEIDRQFAISQETGEIILEEFARTVKGMKAESLLPMSIFRSNEAQAWVIDAQGLPKILGSSVNDDLPGTVNSEGIRGGDGDDVITGMGGNDVLYGNAGNDTIFAENGDDLIYGGNGNDTIDDYGGNGTIDGGAGNDIIAAWGSGTKIIHGGTGDDAITFSSGSDNMVEGGDGNDSIRMNYSNYSDPSLTNILSGGVGNDFIESGNSTDIYLFNRGDGQDTITDYGGGYYSSDATDKLVFGTGIAAGDLVVSPFCDHLVIRITDPANPAANDQITIENWNNVNQRIEQVEFSDGTVWTAADLSNRAMTGTDGADTITLWSDAAWADGRGGDDVIDDHSGYSDAAIYGGDGNDIITGGSGNDTLDGGTGNDIINDWGGDTNILRGGDGNDTMTISCNSNNIVEGGAGDDLIKMDYINGSAPTHANTFMGGMGNDRIESGSSADTYLFNRGDGQDTINDYGYSYYYGPGADDMVNFGSNITADQLWFSRVGDNLEVGVIGTDDEVTVENWYIFSGYHIEQFKTADGKTLLDSQVDNLVSAMAAFNPPAAGQTTLPQDYQEALMPVIAANWR